MAATTQARQETPSSASEAAELLAACAVEGAGVRIVGGATKLGWGRPVDDAAVELHTAGLNRIVDHSEGDFTAVVQPGVPLAQLQERVGQTGQMLALDPPLGAGDAATLGGVVAAADSGPRRHRYGTPRDLVIGVAVALPDGSVARAGGRVIKNVAGYDLSKLMAGAFGTLGLITEICVRLHPLPEATATAVFATGDPDRLAAAASDLAHRPLELEALDVRSDDDTGGGTVLARFAGATAGERAGGCGAMAGLAAEIVEDDEALWAAQRAGQRSGDGTVVRVSALPTELPAVLRAAREVGASVVGRAAAGVSWLTLPGAAAGEVTRLRETLVPASCVVYDAPRELRAALDPWGLPDGPELRLGRRVKARFDPDGVCNPGLLQEGAS